MIDPETSLGPVVLTVRDLDAQAAFYRDALGLRELGRHDGRVEFGAPHDGVALVTLVADPGAPPRPPRTTGLFHLAILVPSRPELARALERVVAAGYRFSGAADHLVSEALYLDDPEGNGIEIYRDRPREQWEYDGVDLRMGTFPLDLESLLSEGREGSDDGMPAGTAIGHVHLQVADLEAAESFYAGVLGFDVTVRGYPGALFVSAGGYHHHLGLNTWAGVGAPAPPRGALGLRHFTVGLSDPAALDSLLSSVAAAGFEVADDEERPVIVDPSGNRAVLTVG